RLDEPRLPPRRHPRRRRGGGRRAVPLDPPGAAVGSRLRDGRADRRRPARAGDVVRRERQAGGGERPRRRRPAPAARARERLLPAADRLRERHAGDDDRQGGDLRAGRLAAPLERRAGDARGRQRRGVRAHGLDLDEGRHRRAAHGLAGRGRLRLDQRRRAAPPRHAVRRAQAVRRGPRGVPRRAALVHRPEDDHGQAVNEPGHDLAAIGMGAAGLSAAVAFSDARPDGRAAVLERAPESERGGATRYTGSWFRVGEDRTLDPRFPELMERFSGGLADLEYCRALEAEVPASIAFLEEHGVPYTYFAQGLPNRNTGGGLEMPVGGGAAIVSGLAGVLESREGVELLYETEALRLTVSEDGRVDGVLARGRDGLLRKLAARAVVIASGGFEGNPEMLTQYLGERASELPVIAPGPRNNRGEGIRMAMEVGADTAGRFDLFHGEPVDPRTSKPDAVVYPYTYGILV